MTSKDRWGLGLLLFFVIVTVCAMNDPYLLGGWIVLALLWFGGRKKAMCLSWIDIGVVVLWVYDLTSLFTTINEEVTRLSIIPVTLAVFYYFVLRVEFRNRQKFKKLLYFLSLFLGILGWFGLIAFGIFASAIREVGWQNLYDFRFLHRPLGNIANVWGSLLIVFFMIVYIALMLYRKQRKSVIILWGCLFPIIFGLVTSFSRGVYIAFFMLLLLCIGICLTARGRRVGRKIGGVAGLCCCTFLVMAFYPREVVRTLRMTETVSQQRSIEGRVERSIAVAGMLKESPLTGAGMGNYTLITNAGRYEDDLISYTNFAPNMFVQLLAEKGILGFALWGMFAIYLFWFFFRHRRNKWMVFLGGCFLILLVREATFPVFLETPGFMILGLTLLAFGQSVVRQKGETRELSPGISRYVRLGCVLLFIGMYVNLMLYYRNERYNLEFLEAVKNKEYDKAREAIEKTSERTPYLINQSLMYSLLEDWEKAEYYTILALEKNPWDVQLQYNLARIYTQSGKTDLSRRILENLVKVYPNNFLYQWGMFDLCYSEGKKDAAIPCLVRVIELTPRMMDSSFWEKLREQDRETVLAVQMQLKNRVKEMPAEPILLANYAKVALSLKDTVRAEELYREVIQVLPNLIYPWYYLGVIECDRGNTDTGIKYLKCFMRLAYGSLFTLEQMEENITSGKLFERVEKRPFLSTKYLNKFAVWYRSNTLELPVSEGETCYHSVISSQ